MKKKIGCLALLGVLTLSMLTGCGSHSTSSKGLGDMAVTNSEASFMLDDYDMDYSSTYIDSSYTDYSYTLYASGESKKSKNEMLKDYEDIQTFVKDHDGYIENVNNSYNVFDKDRNRYYGSSSHKTYGTLSFTIQIDKDNVDEVIDKLDEICKNNNLVVTTYNQRITNYEGTTVVDRYDDYYQYDTITKEELEKRLKYADISVQLNYYTEFNAFEKAWMGIGNAIREFWDDFGELVQTVLIILFIAYILFFNICIWYKMFRKMQYKHKNKHPEFYEPKPITIVEKKSLAARARLKASDAPTQEKAIDAKEETPSDNVED